jgi:hypothetical protein
MALTIASCGMVSLLIMAASERSKTEPEAVPVAA